jgi:hypothetical protein
VDDWLTQVPQTRCVQARLHCALPQPLSDHLHVERAPRLILPGEVDQGLGRVVRSWLRLIRLGVPSVVVGDEGRHVDLPRAHRRRHRETWRVRLSIRWAQATEGFAS